MTVTMHSPIDSESENPLHPEEALFHGKSSIAQVTFNFVNAVVGSGILAIPQALYNAGLGLGIFMAVGICALSTYTVQLVVSIGIKEGVKDYEQLMDKLFGFPGYTFILLSLFLYDFGAMLSYLIILGDVCSQVVRVIAEQYFNVDDTGCFAQDSWCLRRACIIIPALGLMLPLCLLRDISRLEQASSFSVYTTVFIIIVVIISSITTTNTSDVPWFTAVGNNPAAAFGVFAFAFVCHDTAFLFFGSLRNPTSSRWRKTAVLSLGFAFLICFVFAIPGYIAFRDKSMSNILNNFSTTDIQIILVRILFMLTMSFTYPMCFFICRHIVNELLFRIENRNTPRVPGTPAGLSIKEIPLTRHLVLSLTLFGSSLVISCLVRDLGLVMSLTGNVSAVAIAFIMPPLCAVKSRWHRAATGVSESGIEEALLYEPEYPRRWDNRMKFHFALLIVGVCTMVFCTIQSLANYHSQD